MRIRLERIQRAADRLEAADGLRGRFDFTQVVHIGAVARRECTQQGLALRGPPWLCARGHRFGLGEQLFPGGTHDGVALRWPNQQVVQLLDQAVALVLVHHEGEVEIVRRLAEQVHLLFFEQREGITQLVQDGADVAADQ